jgi:hypothetical protein
MGAFVLKGVRNVNPNKFRATRDVMTFALLVLVGIIGRWAQPAWCFTPTAAVAVFGGYCFSRVAVAALLPITVLAISDTLLPAHQSMLLMVLVYVTLSVPVLFGRMLARKVHDRNATWCWVLCGLGSGVLFYLVTNFGVWLLIDSYAKSWSGLIQCYDAGIPFLRWMVLGDVFYLGIIFGCARLAHFPGTNRLTRFIIHSVCGT